MAKVSSPSDPLDSPLETRSSGPNRSAILCQCSGTTYDDVRKQIIKTPHATFDEIEVLCDVSQECQSCEPLALAFYEERCIHESRSDRSIQKTKRKLLITRLIRSFHLFSSLIAAIFLLFFAFSGYVMNHRAELGLDEIEETSNETTLSESLLSGKVTKTAILEWCQVQGARGDLAEYIQDDEEILISYVCAGGHFDAEIDLVTRNVTIIIQKNGFLETLGEIHRSPSPVGNTSSLFIDIMAVLMAVVSLSGIYLFFRMATRQNKFALVVFLLSIASAVALYLQKAGYF